ncbi:MAG: hypothetical protein MJY90_01590 [Bacteroidaceae bacterium]|nr:hypothetical protein [Bacteroidaceae bacterium]
MERTTRRSERERMQYGICLNDECPKCKSREIQQIPMRKEFVCSECGKELRECAPPKKKSVTPIIIGIVSGVVILGGICYAIFWQHGSAGDAGECDSDSIKSSTIIPDSTKPITTTKSDTVIVYDTIVQNNTITTSEKVSTKTVVTTAPAPKPSSVPVQTSNNGTINLSYGKYTGAIKGGYPHGQGRLVYTTSRQINRNDMKGRTANPGDYVIGEFFNGFVVYGKHYDSEGNLLESLTIGQGAEDAYESK